MQDDPEAEMRAGEPGIAGQRTSKTCLGLLGRRPVQSLQCQTQVQVRFGHLWIALKRQVTARPRGIEISLRHQRRCQIGMQDGVFRLQHDGIPEGGDGAGFIARGAAHAAQVGVVKRDLGIAGNRLPDQIRRLPVPALLMMDQTQQMVGVGMAWRKRQNPRVGGLGGGKIAGLMATDGVF